MTGRGSRWGALLALAVAVWAAGACGDEDPAARAEAVTIDDAIRSSRRAGVELEAAPTGATAIDAAAARRSIEDAFGPEAVAGSRPVLAVLDRADIVDRLVWAFVGRRPCAEVARPIRPKPDEGASVAAVGGAALPCIQVLLADAADGRYLMAYAEPEPAR